MKVKVTISAVKQRLRRRMAKIGHSLKTSRNGSHMDQSGRYLVVNQQNNSLDHTFDDLEKYSRELGILAAHEELMDDDRLEEYEDDYEE